MEPSRRAAVVTTAVVVAVLVAVSGVLLLVGRTDDGTDAATAPGGSTSPAPSAPSMPGVPGATAEPGAVPPTSGVPGDAGEGSGGSPGGPGTGGPELPSDAPTVCVPQQTALPLSVLSFNIHSARARDNTVQLGRIGDEIAGWQPDVVLLQEVDQGRGRTGRVNMPELLGERLDMFWTFAGNNRLSSTASSGVAILSRYPITDSANLALPRPAGTQQRGLLSARLDVEGVPVTVYGTHLESTSSTAREQQMRQILPVLRADRGAKILGGDLNAQPGSPVLLGARTVLADAWPVVGTGDGLTVPARRPRIRIDFLLHGSGLGDRPAVLTPQQSQVLFSSVSDHRAVRTLYELTRDDGEICVPVLPEQSGP